MLLWVRYEDLVGVCENFNIFRFFVTCIDIMFFLIFFGLVYFKKCYLYCIVKFVFEEIKIFSFWFYILIIWIRKEFG